MNFRFTVISSVQLTARFGVRIEYFSKSGFFKKDVALLPYHIKHPNETSLWSVVEPIDTQGLTEPIHYRFYRWESTELPVTKPKKINYELEMPVCCLDNFMEQLPDSSVFEKENILRCIIFSRSSSLSKKCKVHLFNPSENITCDEYILPIATFQERNVRSPELQLIYERQYRRFDYDRILNRIYVGRYPETFEDVLQLRDAENVTDVLCFQSLEDLQQHFLTYDSEAYTEPNKLTKFYKSLNMRFVWHPIKDFSRTARGRNLAQSILLLAAILNRPDSRNVYVHCNAGIGRSIICVCGYLHCIMGLPLKLINMIVCSRRPIALFDDVALNYGVNDFFYKFDGIQNSLVRKLS